MPLDVPRAVSLFQMTVFLVFQLCPLGKQAVGFVSASWPEMTQSTRIMSHPVPVCSTLLSLHVYEGLEQMWLR